MNLEYEFALETSVAASYTVSIRKINKINENIKIIPEKWFPIYIMDNRLIPNMIYQ